MKIGFFGGAFNPPTIAHLNLAKQAIAEYALDKFYFVPVNNYYGKQDLIDFDIRCEMLEIICKDDKKLFVSKIENKQNRNFAAIDIFKIIEKKYKNENIFFIMGEDNYEKMPSWKNYDELMKYNYIVLQRKSNKQLHINEKNISYMKNNENLKISSTLIRNKLNNGESINKYVTKEIGEYIIKNNLYIKR